VTRTCVSAFKYFNGWGRRLYPDRCSVNVSSVSVSNVNVSSVSVSNVSVSSVSVSRVNVSSVSVSRVQSGCRQKPTCVS